MGFAFVFSWIVTNVVIPLVVNFVVSKVIDAFIGTPDSNSNSAAAQSSVNELAGRQQMIRSAIADRRIIYGQTKVSGPIVYSTTTGTDNGTLWLVIALADHECQAIDDVYFNDVAIPNSAIDGNGYVTTGQYANKASIFKHLGSAGQTVDQTLSSNDPTNWDSTHRGDGVAYLVVQLTWDQSVYSSGIPNISAIVRGKKLYDPRSAGSPTVYTYSANWALAVRDYLTNTVYGMGCSESEINDASFIAAANICDERVTLPTVSPSSDALVTSFTALAADDKLTAGLKELLQTGDGVRLTGAPSPLVAATTYYWIRQESGVGKLATSFANSFAGTAIDLTTDGSGSITYYDQARYEAQGSITTGDEPMAILKSLMPAAGGTLVFQQGEWRCYAGAYRATVGTLTVADLRAPLSLQAQPSRRELFNGVRGVFSDPNSAYQPIDFPILTNSTYETQDGGQLLRDITLGFTINTFRAQRIAKMFSEKSRQGMTLTLPCKPTAFKYAVWDNIAVTIAALGFTAKEFTVVRWTFNPSTCGIDLHLQEESSSSYTWSSSSAIVKDQAPDTGLHDPFTMPTIAGLVVSSGTNDLYLAGDGTINSRIRMTWTSVNDSYVTNGGHIEVEYALSAGSPQNWLSAPFIPGDAVETFLLPVQDAVGYYVRIRAVNSLGVASAWNTASHTVAGKSAAPTNVTGFSALQTGAVVLFSCDTVADLDLDSIEIAYGDAGETDVANAIPIANILRGQTATTAALPPGTWVIFARAKDTSGNYSATAATQTLSVTADGFTAISTTTYDPNWTGTLTNMVEHWTGVLTPDSQSLASALGWEVFDEFVNNAYADCYFTAGVIDKGLDGSARIYADIVSVLGPGETTGTAAPAFEVDTRLAAGSFDGFESWSIGNANFRYAQGRIHVTTAFGKPVISTFDIMIDAASRTEQGVLTVTGSGNGAQAFTTTFHITPILQVTPAGSGDVSASYASLTTTGFTGYYKSAGAAAAGDISWQATGV